MTFNLCYANFLKYKYLLKVVNLRKTKQGFIKLFHKQVIEFAHEHKSAELTYIRTQLFYKMSLKFLFKLPLREANQFVTEHMFKYEVKGVDYKTLT